MCTRPLGHSAAAGPELRRGQTRRQLTADVKSPPVLQVDRSVSHLALSHVLLHRLTPGQGCHNEKKESFTLRYSYLQLLSSLSGFCRHFSVRSEHFERKVFFSTIFWQRLKGGNLMMLQILKAFSWTCLATATGGQGGYPGICQAALNRLVERICWPDLPVLSSC